MILIAGGAYQGKTAFAKDLFEKNHCGRAAVVADGAECILQDVKKADILIHFHEYVRRYPGQFSNPRALAEEWEQETPELIIVTNELGYGVVPVDAADRQWREQCGRACTELAARSSEVYRIVCGIGMRLK